MLKCTFHSANWVTINGTKYEQSCVLVIGKTEEDDVLFGEVTRIIVDIKSVYFEFKLYNSFFNRHHHCYCLSTPAQTSSYVIHFSKLIHYHPYGLYFSQSFTNTNQQFFTVLRTIIE